MQNVDVVMQDEDKSILLLNAIPKSYGQFKDEMIFDRTCIAFDEVQTMVKTKELQRIKENYEENGGE